MATFNHDEMNFTVAEVRHDGMFPVVFGLFYEVDDDPNDDNGVTTPMFYGVHGAGFVCLDKDSAQHWASQIDAHCKDRQIAAVPLKLAQERYKQYLRKAI